MLFFSYAAYGMHLLQCLRNQTFFALFDRDTLFLADYDFRPYETINELYMDKIGIRSKKRFFGRIFKNELADSIPESLKKTLKKRLPETLKKTLQKSKISKIFLMAIYVMSHNL